MKKKLSIKYKNKNKKSLKNKNRNKNRKSLKNKNKKSLKNRNKNRNKKSLKNKTRNGSTNNLSINKQIGGAEAFFKKKNENDDAIKEKDKLLQNQLLELYNYIFPQSAFYNSLMSKNIIITTAEGASVFNPSLTAEYITKQLAILGSDDSLTDIILEYGDTDYYYVFGHGMECYNVNDASGANYDYSVSGIKMGKTSKTGSTFKKPENGEKISVTDIGFDFEILFSSLPNQSSWMDTNTILHQIFVNHSCTDPISVLAQKNDEGQNLIKDCINPQGIKNIHELGGVKFSLDAYNLFLSGSDLLVHTYIHLNLMNYYKYGPGSSIQRGNAKWDKDLMGDMFTQLNHNKSYFNRYFSLRKRERSLMINIQDLCLKYTETEPPEYSSSTIPQKLKDDPRELLNTLGFTDTKLTEFKSLVKSTIIQELEGLFNHTHGVYKIVKGGREEILKFEPGLNYNLKEICEIIRHETYMKSINKQQELFTQALSVAASPSNKIARTNHSSQVWSRSLDIEQRTLGVKERLRRGEFSQNKKIRLFVLACRSPYHIVIKENNEDLMKQLEIDLDILLGITPTSDNSSPDNSSLNPTINIEYVDEIVKLPDIGAL